MALLRCRLRRGIVQGAGLRGQAARWCTAHANFLCPWRALAHRRLQEPVQSLGASGQQVVWDGLQGAKRSHSWGYGEALRAQQTPPKSTFLPACRDLEQALRSRAMLLLTIFSFVLYSIACAIAGACLLRVLLQAQRIGFSHHPLGQLLLALTDWLVRPARRVLRPQGRWDWLTLLLAYAVLLAHWLLMWLLQQLLAGGLLPWSLFALAPLQALFSLLRLGLYLALTLLVLYVALFWAQPRGHWLHHLSELLCTPWLAPLRRLLPTAGGIDFSPMALGLLLAIALMVLRWLEFSIIAPALFSQPLPRLAIPFG
ncbi:hypothetical protein CK625_03235 [Vandammella animalimorsus]|uniref:YggT family protein n=2 Tax=Vandammella animalimorsus TaxID=2029117 RepID=A0A2A2AIV6_9BURK|nr:hypothetical protein CK625_03235 [Vandammella animalimorsus]